MKSLAFERDELLYLVTPVAPIDLAADAFEELAFADSLRSTNPNDRLVWMRGQYVEGDRPNSNGALWLSDELSVKSLTPRLMPVTVMHDFRTAVGLIADTSLVAVSDTVPRARIDTTLALWGHRFPDVVEEALANYSQGTLMQSMECHVPRYECNECGQLFVKLPDGAERAGWCSHLLGETAAAGGKAARRLLDVTFTGTGLIFGTRGATGALNTSQLDVFQDEVAEFHLRAGRPATKRARSKTRMETIEIARSEYDELKAKAAQVPTLEARISELEPEVAKVPTLTAANEKLEIDKKAAEDLAASEKAAKEALEETARTATLAGERLSKLGAGFTAKLPATVKTVLDEQAKTLADDAWKARLDELAELTGVAHDEGAAAATTTDAATFTADEVARAALNGGGNGGGNGGSQTQQERSRVMGGLFKQPAKPAEPAAK